MSKALAEQRKQQSQELRKAHFYMGFDQEITKESNAAKDYKVHDLQGTKETTKEMNALRKDLRATHFLLGTDDPAALYTSSATASYKEPQNFQRSVLSQDTKKDLRSQHFVFGFHDGCKQSENTRSFPTRPLQVQEDRLEQANALRAHSHHFGDKKNYFNTMYNKAYCETIDDNACKQASTKTELAERIIFQRKSNIKMGEKQQPYDTQHKTTHQGKDRIDNEIKDNNLRETNITLGNYDKPNISHAQDCYRGAYQKMDHEQNKSLASDLRKAHFYMGEDDVNYTSENKGNYQQGQAMTKKPDMSYLYKGSISFNQQLTDPSTQYTSMYKKDISNNSKQDLTKIPVDSSQCRVSSIVLGSQKIQNQYLSENAQNFANYGTQQSAKLDRERINDLKNNHFDLGEDKCDFKTQVNINQSNKTRGVPGCLDPEMKKDLRSQHFVFAFQKNDWKTSNATLAANQGERATLDPQIQANLKKTNIEDNSYKCDFKSVAKMTYQDPGPVV